MWHDVDMKCQVVLDIESKALLDALAKPRGNNRSFVVREALRVYAAMEGYLDDVERQPGFRKAMDAAVADLAAGRLRPQADAARIVRKKRR